MRYVSLLPFFAAGVLMAGDDGPRLLDNRIAGPNQKPTQASIRVNVDMTLVPVTVMDSNGHNVLGLGPDNFRVVDGAEQRPIVTFNRQDAPVSIGLVYDCSQSMTDKYRIAREAPTKLFEQLNPEDEAFLVTVAERAMLRHDYTSDFSEIRDALLFVNPTGSTSLLDGVYLGLQHLRKAHNPRKALIIVSDGGDNNSRYTLRELTKLAAEADAQIFCVGLFDHPKTQEEAEGPALLGSLSQSSGGIKFTISDLSVMATAFGQIGVTLHNQYVLGYYPPEDAPSGKYRKIKVQLLIPSGLPRLQIFARSGYYMP